MVEFEVLQVEYHNACNSLAGAGMGEHLNFLAQRVLKEISLEPLTYFANASTF